MRKITTTHRPDVELRVEESEYLDLDRQGFVLTVDGAPAETARSKKEKKSKVEKTGDESKSTAPVVDAKPGTKPDKEIEGGS